MLVNVAAREAIAFIERHHYSRSAQPGAVRYGWADEDGTLLGVTIYGPGAHAMRAGVFGPEHYASVLHHHRLALHPDAPHGSASRFIGASLRRLRADRPHLRAVVTYADLCEGHAGVIYQATNAVFTGTVSVGNLKFRTGSGGLRSTQGLAGTWPERREEARRRGWTEVRCKGKRRYVYLLGTPKQRRAMPPMRWPTLPYPPRDARSGAPTPDAPPTHSPTESRAGDRQRATR